MLFLLDVILVLTIALLISSAVLRDIPSRKIYLLTVYLINFATIVLTALLLGLVYHLANPLAWLLLHIVFLGGGVFVWRRAGSPHLLGPWATVTWRDLNLLRVFSRDPSAQLLLLGVAGVYALGTVLILMIPPNNWDSMTYHLSKIGFWLQNSTLFPWETYNPRQTTFPINAELGNLWSVVFTSSDRFVSFTQWTAASVSMVAIVGLAQQIGFTRKAGLFAALIWATFPIVQFESTTTQNDLVLAAFFLSGLYLCYEGWRRSNRTLLLLSALAVGLTVGTKSTALFLLPGLALVVLILALSQRKFDLLVIWGVACVVTVLIFGSFIYLTNFAAYHHFLGNPDLVEDHIGTPVSRPELMRNNTFRYVYQMVDLMLPPPYAESAHAAKTAAARPLANLLGIPVFEDSGDPAIPPLQDVHAAIDEDLAWFGPLGFLLLLPAMIYGLYTGIRKRAVYQLGLVIIAVVFLLAHSLAAKWTPFNGRYYVTFAAVLAPLMAVIVRPDFRFRLLRIVLVVIAISGMLIVVLGNPTKPIYRGGETVLQKSRLELQAMGQQGIQPYLNFVAQIPVDEPVGVMFTAENYNWDYPLFLPGFKRTVIPFVYDEAVDSVEALAQQTSIHQLFPAQTRMLTDQPLNYLVVSNIFVPELDTSGFIAASDGHVYTYFVREGAQ